MPELRPSLTAPELRSEIKNNKTLRSDLEEAIRLKANLRGPIQLKELDAPPGGGLVIDAAVLGAALGGEKNAQTVTSVTVTFAPDGTFSLSEAKRIRLVPVDGIDGSVGTSVGAPPPERTTRVAPAKTLARRATRHDVPSISDLRKALRTDGRLQDRLKIAAYGVLDIPVPDDLSQAMLASAKERFEGGMFVTVRVSELPQGTVDVVLPVTLDQEILPGRLA